MGRVLELYQTFQRRVPIFALVCTLLQIIFMIIYGTIAVIDYTPNSADFPLPQPRPPGGSGFVLEDLTYLKHIALFVYLGLGLQGTYLRRSPSTSSLTPKGSPTPPLASSSA
jgi:hypothetical protein